MTEKVDYYFAYGSNLNREQMQKRCPGSAPVEPYILEGWKLIFRRVADIVPAPGERVYGALYTITPADELALDRYERFQANAPDQGWYTKVHLDLPVRGAPATVMFYVMNGGEIEPPPGNYFQVISTGFADWGLPPEPLEAARLDAARSATSYRL